MSHPKLSLIYSLHVSQNIGLVLAQLTNLTLLLLIWKKASDKFGTYRYLMAIFAIYSVMFTWTELVVQPIMYTEAPVFAIMADSRIRHNVALGQFLVALYCGTFALCISLLACHFVYRYLIVCKPEFHMNGYKLMYILSPCPVFFLIWFSLVYFGMEGTTKKIAPFKATVLEHYSMNIDEIAFAALAYWYKDENGEQKWNLKSVFSLAGFDAIIGSCVSVIFICGVSIFRDLKQKASLMSEVKMDFQKQLLVTLTIQTLVPFCLMYMTVGFIITTPLLSVDLGVYANIPGVALAVYPCIEPCVAIVCIRDFRRAFKVWKQPSVTPSSRYTSDAV